MIMCYKVIGESKGNVNIFEFGEKRNKHIRKVKPLIPYLLQCQIVQDSFL